VSIDCGVHRPTTGDARGDGVLPGTTTLVVWRPLAGARWSGDTAVVDGLTVTPGGDNDKSISKSTTTNRADVHRQHRKTLPSPK